jgi:hypothetical protein
LFQAVDTKVCERWDAIFADAVDAQTAIFREQYASGEDPG